MGIVPGEPGSLPPPLWSPARGLFANRITRPLCWAIPLQVVGALAVGLLLITPVRAAGTSCASVVGYWVGGERVSAVTGTFGSPTRALTRVSDCGTARRRRLIVSDIVGTLTALPLIILAVRGFLWGAGVLARVEERLDAVERERRQQPPANSA